MLRMMMWSSKDGETRFIDTMHDFLDTYRLKAATTEDFKAIVEKHMSPQMNLDGNNRMDWFFNEYVYGTELPAYHFEGDATDSEKGTSVHIKIAQSGVSPQFKMLVPVYLELANGHMMRLGAVTIAGPSTFEKTVQIPRLPSPIKRVLINYNCDVLSTDN